MQDNKPAFQRQARPAKNEALSTAETKVAEQAADTPVSATQPGQKRKTGPKKGPAKKPLQIYLTGPQRDMLEAIANHDGGRMSNTLLEAALPALEKRHYEILQEESGA